jgi:hypothetical protein
VETNPLKLNELTSKANADFTLNGRAIYVPTVKIVRQVRRTWLDDQPGGLFAELMAYWAFIDGQPTGSSQAELGGEEVLPDGLIRVSRGQRSWTALVEVKTGTNELAADQLETYLDVAREQGFDAVLTISNQIPAVAGQHPTKVDKRRLRKVALHHLSWSQVLSEAVMQKEHRGVADPDQAWILGELIRYLEHPRSGALEFEDMGPAWVGVRDAVAASTLRATDKAAADVAARFDALLRYASLRLGRRLGTDVTPALSRKELADPTVRAQALLETLVASGTLTGAIRIPHTVGQLEVTADLRAGKVTCHVDVAAPRDGRPATRVNWLVRQLKNAPDAVRVEAFTAHSRGASSAELLRTVRDNPALLIVDPAKELRTFRIALDRPLGAKRGRGRASFIDSVSTPSTTSTPRSCSTIGRGPRPRPRCGPPATSRSSPSRPPWCRPRCPARTAPRTSTPRLVRTATQRRAEPTNLPFKTPKEAPVAVSATATATQPRPSGPTPWQTLPSRTTACGATTTSCSR